MHINNIYKVALAVTATGLIGCQEQEKIPLNYSVTTVSRSSAALKSFESCTELEERLKSNLKEELKVRLLSQQNSYYYGGIYPNDVVEADGAYAESNSASSSKGDSGNGSSGLVEGEDYSGTNNQEEGVDEDDIVKTDGSYIYVLNKGLLEVLAVPSFGQLEKVSRLSIDGYPRSMLLSKEGDKSRVIVFSSIYSYSSMSSDGPYGYFTRYSPRVKMTIVDLSDHNTPKVEKELYLEGSMMGARLVDGVVRLVNYSWIEEYNLRYYPNVDSSIWNYEYGSTQYKNLLNKAINEAIEYNNSIIDNMTLDDFLPVLAVKNSAGKWEKSDFTNESCHNFQMAEDGVSRGINSIFTIDLAADDHAFEVDHIVADYSVMYSSKNDLILAEPAQSYWWYWNFEDVEEATNIHRFDISDSRKTVYTGSARIPGTIEDQFSLSEYNGVIRAAVTTGRWNRWWLNDDSVNESRVYTLGGAAGQLDILGHVDGIAPGEQIYSARFSGDRGYLVTFRNTDPLWTIDMSDAANPKVMGELQVPGVSTYIHPIDGDSFLLTIGYGGTDTGLNWQPQISLFDVRDFSKPSKIDGLTLGEDFASENGWHWSYSEAIYEHKAFQYWGPMSMLAVPMESYRYYWDSDDNYNWEDRSLLKLINVDPEEGLSIYGEVDHSSMYSDSDQYWYWGSEVRRSIFMGEYVYAISPAGITCTKVDGMRLTSRVLF